MGVPHRLRGQRKNTASIQGAVSGSTAVRYTLNTGTVAANVALTVNGAIPDASSFYPNNTGTRFAPAGAFNGDRAGAAFGNNGGWSDDTSGVFPDYLYSYFGTTRAISEVDVFSMQDNYTNPSVPTESMTFTLYGLVDFQVQYWTGSAWADVPGGNITGNNLVWRKLTFSPAVTTNAIRLAVNATSDPWTRVIEVEAWCDNVTALPPVIQITSPRNGQIIQGAGSANVQFDVTVNPARDVPGGSVRVQLLNDGVIVAEDNSGTFGAKVLTDSARAFGTYSYVVKAIDQSNGLTQQTIPITITVQDQTGMSGDFAARSAGAVRVERFDTAESLGVQNATLSQIPNCFIAGAGPIEVITTGGPETGSGILRFTVPWYVTTQNVAGIWGGQYGENWDLNFGGNSVHYVQFRTRYNAAAVQTIFLAANGEQQGGIKVMGSGPGYKVGRDSGQDHVEVQACTSPDFAWTTHYQLRAVEVYHSCGRYLGLYTPVTNIQSGRPAPYCQYPDFANCQLWPIDKWMTWQYRVELGPRVSAAGSFFYAYTVFDTWYADEDTPEYLLHHWDSRIHGSPDQPWFGCGFQSYFTDGDYGKIWFLPYMTAPLGIIARPEGSDPAIFEYSELIVKANSKIPTPATRVPTNFNPLWLQELRNNPANKNKLVPIPGTIPGAYDIRAPWDTTGARGTWAPTIFKDYCGNAYDRDKFRIYFAAHGGHGTVSQNGIQCCDLAINDDNARYRLLRPSTFHFGGVTAAENGTAYFPSTPPYDVPAGGNGPVARHTEYNELCFPNDDGTSEIILTWPSAGCFLSDAPLATDSAVVSADGTAASYRPAGTWQTITGPVDNDAVVCADYKNKVVYDYQYTDRRFRRLDIATKTWTFESITTDGWGIGRVPAVYDENRHRVVVFGADAPGPKSFGVWDINANTYTNYPISGDAVGLIGTTTQTGAKNGATHVYKPGQVDYYLIGGASSIVRVWPDLVSGTFQCDIFCPGYVSSQIGGGVGLYNRICYVPNAGGCVFGPIEWDQPAYFLWTDGTN